MPIMEIDLHPGQSEVYEDIFLSSTEPRPRFFVDVCSRGWGKSYLASVAAVTAVYELMELPEYIPNKRVYVIAPTHDDVTEIYYGIINYELGMEHVALSSSRDRGRFTFPNNVTLHLLSYEAVERIRGKGVYFLVWDEVSSCTKGVTPRTAWEGIIEPAIRTRWSRSKALQYNAPSPGRALFIGTPRGYNYFYDLYNKRESNKEWKSYQFDYHTSPYLDPNEIDHLRDELDPIEFASEYLASFKESGNNVFYCFDRSEHVSDELMDFQDKEDVHVCIDFNVGIQASAAFALRGGQMQFLEEFRGHPDTESLAISLKERYMGHKIHAYPDPTGNARKTSAPVGTTDFAILRSNGIEVYARGRSPGITDSVAAVNRKLKTARGHISMFFHPRCRGLIQSMERTKWLDRNPDTATIDKSEGIEHFSDGVRYATEYLYPVLAGTKRSERGFGF
jgi:hypothetical protein